MALAGAQDFQHVARLERPCVAPPKLDWPRTKCSQELRAAPASCWCPDAPTGTEVLRPTAKVSTLSAMPMIVAVSGLGGVNQLLSS